MVVLLLGVLLWLSVMAGEVDLVGERLAVLHLFVWVLRLIFSVSGVAECCDSFVVGEVDLVSRRSIKGPLAMRDPGGVINVDKCLRLLGASTMAAVGDGWPSGLLTPNAGRLGDSPRQPSH